MADGDPRPTDQWPMVPHRCDPTAALIMLRFKGAARDGREVGCDACGARFVYRKPAPTKAAAGVSDGPRTHF